MASRKWALLQETKRRAGTENLPQIVGLTKALELAITNQDANNVHLMNLKELFLVQLQERAIPFELNGSMTERSDFISIEIKRCYNSNEWWKFIFIFD